MAGDARFFPVAGPHALATIAAACGATLPEGADGGLMLRGLATLAEAQPQQLAFLDNRRYLGDLAGARAGAVLVQAQHLAAVPQGTVALLTETPYLAWARAGLLFHPDPPHSPGIHPTAVIDPTARVDASAQIGPFVVIGPGAEVGAGCRVEAHAVLGHGVALGEGCRVGPQASVRFAILGKRVTLAAGVRIGEVGFGFAVTPQGFVPVPQLGRVLIEDDVDIGANTTIDRGAGPDTVIGAGTRIDNLVQIGHNVRVGRGCVIVSQVGISGSTVIGDFVQIAGQAGLIGHLDIGTRARIGGQAGVMNDVPPGADVIGSPARRARDYFKTEALLRRLVGDRGRANATKREGGVEGQER